MGQQFDIVGNLLLKVDGAEAGINKLKSSLSKLKMPEGLENSFKKSFANLDTLFARYKSQVEKGFDTKADVNAFSKTSKALDAELTRISKHFTELTGKEVNFKVKSDDIIRTEKELEKLLEQKAQLSKDSLKFKIEGGKDGIKDIETLLQKMQVAAGKTKTGEGISNALGFLKAGDVQSAITLLEKASVSVKRFKQEKQDAFKIETGFDMSGVLTTIISMLNGVEGEFGDVNAKITETKNNLTTFQAKQIQDAGNYAEELSSKMENSASTIRQADGAMQEFARSSQSMSQQLGDLQQSTQYFFSLRNMINLLRRGIDDAIQSVKELDKAMTDTAVVTDFSVGDMWKDLPKYTQLANELGATTKGAYETMTLYYQQGLDQQQAFALGAETMKMARIAGLDYAETTDMMTAALRGFNMELDETSAKRVNDVYSKLAAITASDTEELGTAMQRTASIAASAGASFEGTTAFLAQAIETTREPAENIGTAMKTIVARFQEMKKNPLEISEVDGEEVDYNKIDAALRTIGVDLKDTNGQFRDFDQVMLDISAKWDTLSQSQQRYIATTAAGSRQQSRFIAMVSDYDRTMQLMEAANNSAGASEEQFGKTAESLEFKLNKLHNAWELFTMGIANNAIIKGAVDGITTLLTGVNDLINKLSLGIGPVKSFLSLLTAFTGLKIGGKLVNSLIGGLGGLVDPTSSFGKGFKGGFFNQERNSAQAITNPIVQAIHQLQSALTNKPVIGNQTTNNAASLQDFKTANTDIRALLKGTGVGSLSAASLYGKIGKLDDRQQAAILGQLPGLQLSLQKKGIQFNSKDISRSSAELITAFNQEINTGLKNKNISGQAALQMFGTPDNFKTAMKARGPEYFKAANEIFTQAKRNYFQNQANAIELAQGFTPEAALELAKKQFRDKSAEERKQVIKNIESDALEEAFSVEQTKGEALANAIGNIGTVAINAGQGIAQLGMQLSDAGFEQAGAAVTNLGYKISSLGQIATGVGSAVGKVANVLNDNGGGFKGLLNLIKAHPMITAVAGGIAAVTTLIIALNKHTENIKKKGEEVVQTYTDASSELKNSISQVQSYQSELTRLSAGVDENGLNVNLDTSEYERYKEIVNDLVKQNPEIVKGWNSEGQAIIDVNNALKDTIALKQKALREKKDNYLSDISGQQLINARNVTTGYTDTRSKGPYVADQSDFLRNAQKVADSISKSSVADAATAAGFDLEKIKQGDIQAIRFLQDHYSLLESIYKQSGEEISSDLSSQIGELSDGLKAYDEAISPLVDYLTEYATEQNLFADLPVELTSAFNEGIKSIAGQNLDISEMKGLTNLLSLQLRDAFDEAKPLLDDADTALNTFTQDLNEAAYNEEASRIAQQLRNMADEAEALGHTEVAQWYENQASRVENAISNATESIAENIDTLADNIANAKTNFEALGESINDYYSLADQAHGLVETALEEKNTEGRGSKTFWNTYRGLASEDAYNEHDIDKAVANMKQFQKYFTEGAEGSRAFAQKLIDWQDKEFKFTEKNGKETTKTLSDFFKLAEDGTMSVTDAFTDLTDEQYAQLASVFDLSADGFTAVLNKLRQFGDLDFDDPAGIRRALALDDRSVKTQTSITAEDGKEVSRLYYGESVLKAEMADLEPDKQKEIVDNLTVNGSIQLPTGAENLLSAKTEGGKEGSLLAQFVKDTQGSNNQVENVMKALIQSGEYNKDELQTIHGELTKEGGLLAGADDSNKHFDDLYNGITESLEDPTGVETNNILGGIDSTVNTIAGILAAGKVKEGYLPDSTKQSAQLQKDLIGEVGKVDSWAQLFARGKDEKGNAITNDANFKALFDKLTSVQTANNNYIKELEAGRQAAVEKYGEGSSQVAGFDDEIAAAKDNAALIAQYLENAATNYFQNLQQAQQATDAAVTKLTNLSTLGLTPDEKQTGITNVLQQLAGDLQKLNWNPEQIQGYFKDNFQLDLKLDENGQFAVDVGQQIKEQIDNLGTTEINALLKISSITLPGAAKGKNNTPSAIRRVGTMARGSKKRGYTINGEPTLTGELGPELVWEPKQNAAYMVGEHGPQFANLSKNAVVWNAQQTKKIKKNSKGITSIGTGARGIHSFGTMASGNVGGTKIPGTLEVDANANILDIIPPTPEPEIPVKAKLEVEGNNSGGLLSKLFGGRKSGPSINVAANVTSIKTGEQLQTIPVIGNITQLNTATTANNINATATVTQVTKSAQVAGEPIQVKATATTTKVENNAPKQAPVKTSAGTQTMNVTANTSAAQAKINQLISLFNKTYTLKYKASGPTSIKVPISANFTGSWKKTVEITKSGANGINNKGFGSLAKGSRYGTIGPNGNGGLTLTGEKGFEIAWLPSENRSMILGANGPQMLNLPKDAVVFTNKQSKKILNQKAIPAGSHAGTTAHGSNILGLLGGTGGRGGGSKNNNTAKNVDKTAKIVRDKAKEAAEAVKKVTVWWENIARLAEAAQRRTDQNQKAFEKYIKEMRATLKNTGVSLDEGGGGGDDYIKNLSETLGYYQAEFDKASQELTQITTGIWQTGKKAGQKATSKKSKKKKKKKNQTAYEEGADNIVQVSYEGKTKKGKKTTKTAYVDLSKYITEENGTYVIDQAALDSIKNKKERQAVADAANKEVNDRLSKKYKAEDEIQKANEAIEKFGEELYETFFKWENELTKIWELTQKIEQTESRINRAKSYQELLESQIANSSRKILDSNGNSTGLSTEMINIFSAGIAQLQQEVHLQVESLGEQKKHLQDLLNTTQEQKTLQNIEDKLLSGINDGSLNQTEIAGYEKYATELENTIAAQAQAWKYMTISQFSDGTIQMDFDTTTFEADKENGGITGDLAKEIQDYVKELIEANKELNSQYETITSKMVEMNGELKTLQDEWVGYADELWQISDTEQKKQVDNLKKISDSINNNLKKLLDDVKRKLDQRRQQEDNTKTEQDISRKQQRLAALRADTSGGHQVEIAQLQQEIIDSQQNYQRSLEDQLLDNLQQQADLAAQQREQQIALQEATITAVNNAALVTQWMGDPVTYKDVIFEAYKTANDFNEKPKALQDELIKKFESMFAGLVTNQKEQSVVQTALKELGQEEEKITGVLETVKDSIQSIQIPTGVEFKPEQLNTEIKVGDTKTKAEEAKQTIKEEEERKKAEEEKQQAIADAQKKYDEFLYNRGDSKSKDKNKGKIGKDGYLHQVEQGAILGKSEFQVAKELAATKELSWKEILTAAKKAGRTGKTVKAWNSKADKNSKFRKAFEKVYGKWSKYASGGIADYTGPAWLDGTPSKPELVLNSTDTKNFLTLRDVLSKALNSTNSVTNSYGGDAMYEININVDHLSSDYDVDKVVEKVKKEITKGAGYRNVTQVRNFR